MRFPDGTHVAVTGLDEILAELHAEGRQTDRDTADEIIIRLEAKGNHIPAPDIIRREYRYLLLKEYEEYVKHKLKIT